jgi:hypothetical protein
VLKESNRKPSLTSKEPYTQEAGIAACSTPSQVSKIGILIEKEGLFFCYHLTW